MKTANFQGKVNDRRKVAFKALKRRYDNLNAVISENDEMIKSLTKQLKEAGKDNKEIKEKLEEMIIRNKAILKEINPLNKELAILETRIVSTDVARASRTKKSNDGRRRRVRKEE